MSCSARRSRSIRAGTLNLKDSYCQSPRTERSMAYGVHIISL
ncbi:MAG: hypothetical protein ACLUNQ_08425 [Oscillospiraceae bacterium]